MRGKILLSMAVTLATIYSVSAYSRPDKLIPKPVGYTTEEGVYTLKPNGADIKVYLNTAPFNAKVADLPDFAK